MILINYFLFADPSQVNWLVDGCETHQTGVTQTECHCNHLTYFSILVVRHAADPLLFSLFLLNIVNVKDHKINQQKSIYT